MTVKVTLTNVWISILLNVVLFLSRILFYKLNFLMGENWVANIYSFLSAIA